MAASEIKGKRILVVDDEPENIQILTEYLSREGHTVANASEGNSAIARLRAWKPHIVFLDINMPGISGLELIPKLRAASPEEYVSIVLVSANMAVEDVARGFEAGADDYMTKPVRSQEVLSRIRVMLHLKEVHDAHKKAAQRSEELALGDEVTGLFNMRTFFRKANEELLRARRFKKPVSALLINIDGFASVNEAADFVAGSDVLRETGQRIQQSVRSIDLVGRVGADEFVVLLVETDLAGAEFIAEKIRDTIKSKEFRAGKGAVNITASVGIAGVSYQGEETDMARLFRHGSEALKSAKSNGTSLIEIYSTV